MCLFHGLHMVPLGPYCTSLCMTMPCQRGANDVNGEAGRATHSNTRCTLGTSWVTFLLLQAVACADWRHRRVRHQPERPPERGSRAARERQGVTFLPMGVEQCTVQHIEAPL